MRTSFLTGIIIFSLLPVPVVLTAQYSDTSSRIYTRDSAFQLKAANWNALKAKKAFTYKSFIAPSLLVVYGILSNHVDAFQDINEAVKEEVYSERIPAHTNLDNYLQYAPAVAVYGLNLAGIHSKNSFRDRTIIYALSNVLMSATVNLTKNLTAQTRPDGSDKLSFPSGHTATAFAAAEFLRQEYKDVSPLYGIGGYLAATVTGYLRISNNKHWTGDVVAGAGVGIISTRLAYWIYPSIKRKLFKDREVHTMVLPDYRNGAFGLGLVHQF